MGIALLLSNTRGAIVAAIVGFVWIVVKRRYFFDKRWVPIVIIVTGLSIVLYFSGLRELSLDSDRWGHSAQMVILKQLTSDRIYLWGEARKGFMERPLFGWGFNGLAIYEGNRICMPDQLAYFETYLAMCKYEDQVYSLTGVNTKAHNIFMDDLVSIGIFGVATKLFLFVLYAIKFRKSPEYQAVELIYFIYLLTWFDNAQMTYLAWWIFSSVEIVR